MYTTNSETVLTGAALGPWEALFRT